MKPVADEYFQASVEGEITAVYVDPTVAGEGIGKHIYSKLEAYAYDQNVSSLGLWASLNAVPFSDAMGYERVTDHSHEFQVGVEGRIVEMRKALD